VREGSHGVPRGRTTRVPYAAAVASAGVVVDDQLQLVVFEEDAEGAAAARSTVQLLAEKPDVVGLEDPSWPLLVRAVGSGSVTAIVSSERHGADLRTLLDLVHRPVTVNVVVTRTPLLGFVERVVSRSTVTVRVRLTTLTGVAVGSHVEGRSDPIAREPSPSPAAGVDVAVHNPHGFVRAANQGYAVLIPATTDTTDWSTVAAARRLLGDRALYVLRNDLRTAGHNEQLLELLRRHRGVVDHPRLHEGARQHALTLLALSLTGVPVVCVEVPAEVRDLLGQELMSVIDHVHAAALDDDDDRERLSIMLRRAAMRVHMTGAGSTLTADAHRIATPPVSVLLATNRPHFLEHALRQVDRQTYSGRQLVMALHGDDFPAHAEERVRDRYPGEVDVLRVDGGATLGAALNACLARASGDLVTKMDDDDWYGDDHLWDLVVAQGYSRAEIVGKGAEFVFLSGEDLTIRRFAGGAERYDTTVAGGTLCAGRQFLQDAGGFVRASVGEDRALIEETVSAGGRVYRTHGFGYVLHRHGRHAWQAPDTYFSTAAVTRHPGAALGLALV
jgi:hypothetical protein